jgi:hypothetical protein
MILLKLMKTALPAPLGGQPPLATTTTTTTMTNLS